MSQPASTPAAPRLIVSKTERKSCSTLVSRNITVAGHRTSVRLEPEMWSGLTDICRRERANLNEVCTAIAGHKTEHSSLTAAIRVFVMAYFRIASTEEGHNKAGHGRGAAFLGRPAAMPQPQPAGIAAPGAYAAGSMASAIASSLIGSAIPPGRANPQPAPAAPRPVIPYVMGRGRLSGG